MFTTRFFLSLSAIAICCTSLADELSTSVDLHFNQGKYAIIEDVFLQELNNVVDCYRSDIRHIGIVGYCSPEGSTERNVELSKQRAEATKSYLIDTLMIPDSIIYTAYAGVAWKRLEDILQEQEHPYDYIIEHIYPWLRFSKVTLYIHRDYPCEVVTPITVPTFTPKLTEVRSKEVKPLFAIKTNLLFDIASLINLEIEIPIKRRWSIAAEYICPWWVMDNHRESSKRNRVQLLSGNLEGRYWWGDRYSRPILTGWFTGIYTGIGSYDFEYHAKGYQGEFLIAAGLSGGYAHTINRAQNLRMEYSLGLGYLSSDYKYYNAEYCVNDYWHAVEMRSGRYLWFGPTRAKISLSWLINRKRRY